MNRVEARKKTDTQEDPALSLSLEKEIKESGKKRGKVSVILLGIYDSTCCFSRFVGYAGKMKILLEGLTPGIFLSGPLQLVEKLCQGSPECDEDDVYL